MSGLLIFMLYLSIAIKIILVRLLLFEIKKGLVIWFLSQSNIVEC